MSNQELRPPEYKDVAGDDAPLPSDESPYLTFTQVGAHWHGHSSLKNLFVFGDSYSSRLNDDPDDVNDNTWIDFLTSSRTPAATLNNFAFPGATLSQDLNDQLSLFSNLFPRKTEPGETTFIFFLGINDCGRIPGKDLSSLVEILFNAINKLYADAAARNFILVDVPPTDRSPAGNAVPIATKLAGRINGWNDLLVARASDFSSTNAGSTMLVFSSHKVLSDILDNPGAHGFSEDARDEAGRGIWRDSLHLTSAVHEIIANRMSSALGFD